MTGWALALAVTTTAVVSGCTGAGPGPHEAAQGYADGLSRLDLGSARLTGTDAAAATAAAKSLVAPFGGLRPTVTVADAGSSDGDSTTARLHVSWPLPGGAWAYDTTVPLTKKDGRWAAAWSPGSLIPGAAQGDSVTVTRTTAPRGRILGAGGAALVTARPVVHVGIDKAHGTAAQAAAAAPLLAAAVGVDAASFTRQVQAAGPKASVEAVVLRADDPLVAKARAVASGRPVVSLVTGTRPLAATKTFARPILGQVGQATAEIVQRSKGAVASGDEVGTGGLQLAQDERLRGTPGVRVALVHGASTKTLHETRPVAGQDVTTTLDASAQARAEQLLASVAPASALVAVRPSTGDVLVAASGPGGQGQSTATLGAYAPGSTFKIVSSLALLRAGVTPATPVGCTPTLVVDGRTFENYDSYPADALGQVPLATAFAKSCNTAFISQRGKVTSDQIASAAAGLGLTASPRLGIPAFLGKVPAAQGQTDHAAQMIGQSEITASPLGMATVVASVAAGHPVSPRLVVPPKGTQATNEAPPAPVTAAEAATLRALMRGVVTGGSGALLAGLPGQVIAKTGTAEFGTSTPPQTHAWMVAARGDLAVAVFVDQGQGGSRTAGPLLKAYLEGTR